MSRRCPLAAVLVVALALAAVGCSIEPPQPAAPPAPTVAAPAPSPDASRAPGVGAAAPGGEGAPPLLAAKPAPKAADLEGMLMRANRALESGNHPNAVIGFEEVLAHEPENRRALSGLGQAAQRFAMDIGRPRSTPLYLKSAEAFRKLRALDQPLSAEEAALLPVVLYNEACTRAIAGETGPAFQALKESFEAGFPRIDLVDTDPELDGLRRLPEFAAFQRELEGRHVENLLAATTPFPFDFRLPDLDGKPRALKDLRGTLTVVDIWGTWCLPCRKVVPHLQDLAGRYKDRGLRVVGINYEKEDGAEARDAVRAFVKEFKIDYPCVLGDQATLEQLPSFEGYPTTLFLGPDGKVRLKLSGYQSLVALETAVRRLLDEGRPPASKGE